MEFVRQNFHHYVDEVRKTLALVREELRTDKARDEIDCVNRILCLLESEQGYLNEHMADAQAGLDRLETAIAPLLNEPALVKLKAELADLHEQTWPSDAVKLDAHRRLLQKHVPALGQLATQGNATARDVLLQLLAMESDQFAAVHARREANAAKGTAAAAGQSAGAGAQGIDAARLQNYLRETFPEEAGLSVVEVHNIPGGRSKETTLITLAGVKKLPERIVMRRDIEGGLVPSKTVDEYKIIEIVHRHGGVPVPTPLHCEADKSKLGCTFILVSAVAGRTEGHYIPDLNGRVENKVDVGLQLARILARLHQIDVAEVAGTYLDASVDLLQTVHNTIESTYKQAVSFDAPSRIHIEMAYQWLKQNMHLAADENPLMIHCDVGLHNMLIDKGTISAVLDWELACIASPAREIAKILHLIDYLMPREDFFREYLAAGGPKNAVDPDRVNFYAIMNYMVTNQRARYANQLFFSGQRSDIVMANAGYDSYYRNLTLLANALKAVYPAPSAVARDPKLGEAA